KGAGKIGTTGKGIGPAYTDKVARRGIRLIDTLDKERFYRRLTDALEYQNLLLEKIYGVEALKAEEIMEEYREYIDIIRKHVTDTTLLLDKARREGKEIFFEGAQGTLLDVDYGTYPYVTSSNPTAGGVCTGTGFGPAGIDGVIGVAKAYVTRVGEGPFPTELKNETGDYLREKGHEYGVTTGRPRRCGWFDIPIIKHAVRVNGLTELALTKLDVLTGMEELKVCVGYKYQGEYLSEFPLEQETLFNCEPVYETMAGWSEDISGYTEYEQLPQAARAYIEYIEKESGIPVKIIGTGPEREQIIIR
ncbi:MAG TPA: adenylosuccinate synthase, partial [Halanaerobiales bacterium]|nr:adenylosuccinate synthase [Halanaerobiales bacterium]